MNLQRKNIFVCPYLEESPDGAVCEAALSMVKNNLIKNIKYIDITMCTSRHFESCYIYYAKLKRMAYVYNPQVAACDMLINNRSHAVNSL